MATALVRSEPITTWSFSISLEAASSPSLAPAVGPTGTGCSSCRSKAHPGSILMTPKQLHKTKWFITIIIKY